MPFVWTPLASTWACPALKDEREGQLGQNGHADAVHVDAFLPHI
jgi:hypothetical protein